MKIWPILTPDAIVLDAALADKDAVLRFIALTFVRLGRITDADKVYAALRNREELMSTGIGGGIGIPHAFSSEIRDVGLLLIRLARSIPFQALDGKAVDIVFPLIVPGSEKSLHLDALSGISGLCRTPGFLKKIRMIKDSGLIWEEIRKTEESGNP
ncbi:MAG: PTS sugar transporter subunit IIA [Desulfobacterales bacterium]